MRAVIQLVKESSVTVSGDETGAIKKGLLIFLGVTRDDSEKDAVYLAEKIVNLRIFQDHDDKMNLSLLDIDGEALVVSQFTLYGDCRKGRRPSYSKAAGPEKAEQLYNFFINQIEGFGVSVGTGIFQAMMEVHLVNNGPVTLLVDSDKTF
ncbi:MAG: D-aminoacyl-tRNA deacylase [Thermodesulfobacteriota bacterium]